MDSKKTGSPGPAGFRLAAFPKEFDRNFWETIDKRYYAILIATFFLFYGFAYYMAFQDWSLSDDQISALKKRAIERVYDVELVVPEEEPEPEGGVGPGEVAERVEEPAQELGDQGQERVQESQADKAKRRQASQVDAATRSRELQREVASQGILAIATAAGGAGAGNVAYSDVLADLAGGAGGVGDIGEVVEGTTGIRAATGSGERTRAAKGSGYRKDGEGTGIDDLIADEGVSGGSSFSRRGEIRLSSENVKLTAGAGSRDAESITTAINNQSASVEYCYQKRAKINPNLRGRIDLEIEIPPNGRVSRVNVLKSTLADNKLNQCISRAVRKWRFGAVDTGTVRIRVPFIF